MAGSESQGLEEWLMEFIQQNVSIWVGSRDQHNKPIGVRGAACKASTDGQSIKVFIGAQRARKVIENVMLNGCIAVVISQPTTHRTYQFKGKDARPVSLLPDEIYNVTRGQQTLMEELMSLGFRADFSRAISSDATNSYIGIEFTPTAVFDQTPGASVGKKL